MKITLQKSDLTPLLNRTCDLLRTKEISFKRTKLQDSIALLLTNGKQKWSALNAQLNQEPKSFIFKKDSSTPLMASISEYIESAATETELEELVDILVPIFEDVDDIPFDIAPGSAIVAGPVNEDGLRRVYYEGNLYNAVNLQNFEDKLLVAAGRYESRYPTIAFDMVPDDVFASSFKKVGIYDINARNTKISDEASLLGWLAS